MRVDNFDSDDKPKNARIVPKVDVGTSEVKLSLSARTKPIASTKSCTNGLKRGQITDMIISLMRPGIRIRKPKKAIGKATVQCR